MNQFLYTKRKRVITECCMKQDMDGACSTHGRGEKWMQVYSLETWREVDRINLAKHMFSDGLLWKQ